LLHLGLLFSVLFIVCVSLAFVGGRKEDLIFRADLDSIAHEGGGIVFIAENVDIDVDEPAVTVRWSILACGDEFTLSGTHGIHGSDLCGVPSIALHVYLNQDKEPAMSYDPLQISHKSHGHTWYQNYVQFDDDQVLEVHEARFYPFDSYSTSSSLRIVDAVTNLTIPIHRLLTISVTSSFAISGTDFDGETTLHDGTPNFARDIELSIKRPIEARGYAILLFFVCWMFSHATIAHVVLAYTETEVNYTFIHLISVFAIIVIIPQLRSSMPDAPGLDGVLIDQIGYFPQLVICGFSALSLLIIIFQRGILDHPRIRIEDDDSSCPEKPLVEQHVVCNHAMPTSTRPIPRPLHSYPYLSTLTRPVYSQSFFHALRASPSFVIFYIQFLMYLQPVA